VTELSVVVPTYNRPEALARSLECLQDQSLERDRYEVIVVDDGSRRDAAIAVAAMADRFPDTVRFFHKENGGPAAARNYGIRQAGSAIVVLLQDDIFASRDLLRVHLEGHRLRSDPVIVLGRSRWSREIEVTPFMEFLMQGDQFGFAWIEDPEKVPYNFFYSSNVSFPREAALDVGLFDEAFPFAAWEDTDLGLRLTRAGLRMVYEKQALADHHHPTDLRAFLEKRVKDGRASAILYRKAPECAVMMRYDKRPGTFLRLLSRPAALAAAQLVSMTKLDLAFSPRWRGRLYRLLLDEAYFRGVAIGLSETAGR